MADATYTSLKITPNKSLFSRIFEKLAKAREKEARRLVGQYLATLDDASLKQLDIKREELAHWS